MKYKEIKCPACGASITVNPDSETIVCSHCNTSFIVEDDLSIRYTSRDIDDAKIKEIEAKKDIRQMEIEHEKYKMEFASKEQERKDNRFWKQFSRWATLVGVAVAIILGIVVFNKISTFIKNRSEEISLRPKPGYIRLTHDSDYYLNDYYENVQLQIEDLGFENITTTPVSDIASNDNREGNVSAVIIGGYSQFKSGEDYKASSAVEIQYHQRNQDLIAPPHSSKEYEKKYYELN